MITVFPGFSLTEYRVISWASLSMRESVIGGSPSVLFHLGNQFIIVGARHHQLVKRVGRNLRFLQEALVCRSREYVVSEAAGFECADFIRDPRQPRHVADDETPGPRFEIKVV